MIKEVLGITTEKLIQSGWETIYMLGFSLLIGAFLGAIIAIILWLTRKEGLHPNPFVYTIMNE